MESFKPSKLSLNHKLKYVTRLTGQTGRLGFSYSPASPILVSNKCAPIFNKACILKNTYVPKLLRSMASHWPFVFPMGDGNTSAFTTQASYHTLG
jgi:hypothetical protein